MLCTLLSIVMLAPPQAVAAADPAAPTQSIVASPGSWSASAGPSLAASLTSVSIAESSGDSKAMTAVDENSGLWLSIHDGTSWGAFTSIASDVGETSGLTQSVAYEASTGRLLLAYRKASSSLIYFRTYHPDDSPTLSAEDWYDLGLGSAPDRIILAPEPSSDQMLLVGAAGAGVRAAIWDGASMSGTHAIEASFDNSSDALSARWQKSNAVVLWARSADTTPRGELFDGDAWSPMTGLPGFTHAIRRLELAPSNGSTRTLLLAAVTSDGADHAFRAATFDGTVWSPATTLATQLTSKDTASAAWETSGSNAVAVWQQLGETTLRTARLDSGTWSAAALTSDLGGAATRVLARPAQSDPTGVHALASISIPDPRLEDYVMYASTGPIDLGLSSSVTGTTSVDSGAVLPDPPAVSAGTTPVTIGNIQTETLSPGDYGSLTIGNRSTLNTSSGQYVFGAMTPTKNDFTLNADTTSGPVVLIFTDGDFDVMNQLTLAVTGPGPLEVHVLDGDFTTENSPVINASIITYQGRIELGNSAVATAHLVASESITFINSVTVSPPVWDSPFIDLRPPTFSTEIVAFTVSAGSTGSPTTVVDGWTEIHDLPFDLSWQRPAGLRVTSWREVPSYED